MQNITIYPGKMSGVAAAPPSADETRYALIVAAISQRGVRMQNAESMLSGLKSLGAGFRRESGSVLFYQAPRGGEADIVCTQQTLPLMLGLCVALGGRYSLTCNKQTISRYEEPVRVLLAQTGFKCSCDGGSFRISGQMQQRRIVTDDAALAAGLLLNLSMMDGVCVACSAKDAEPALRHAAHVMQQFGYTLHEDGGYAMEQVQMPRSDFVYAPCGDYAMAAYLLACMTVGGSAGLTGLIADCAQPEMRDIAHMISLGLPVREMDGALFANKARLGTQTVDAREYASIVPIVVALASLSRGRCVIKNIGASHNNGDDTLGITADALASMGADVMTLGGDMTITGKGRLFGGAADAKGNARAAMAICAVALGCEVPTTVKNVPDIGGFLGALKALGVIIQ